MKTPDQDNATEHCEACFGTGQEVEMKPMKLGHKIAIPPVCPTCKGTGEKPEAR
jgi:DnaJ-class molecular chaperone